MIRSHGDSTREDDDDDADISTVPFIQQPVFGRGLWKNPIHFVSPASEPDSVPRAGAVNGKTVAEKYFTIMFPDGLTAPKSEAYSPCAVCGAPFKDSDPRTHYLSPSHQAALPRAWTPSAIDRTRMGLKYMEKHGYDVDARKGLGANRQGMLFPFVPKKKRNRFGLGAADEKEHAAQKTLAGASAFEVRNGRLDAGRIKKLDVMERKKHERLHRMFYSNEQADQYLAQLETW